MMIEQGPVGSLSGIIWESANLHASGHSVRADDIWNICLAESVCQWAFSESRWHLKFLSGLICLPVGIQWEQTTFEIFVWRNMFAGGHSVRADDIWNICLAESVCRWAFSESRRHRGSLRKRAVSSNPQLELVLWLILHFLIPTSVWLRNVIKRVAATGTVSQSRALSSPHTTRRDRLNPTMYTDLNYGALFLFIIFLMENLLKPYIICDSWFQ